MLKNIDTRFDLNFSDISEYVNPKDNMHVLHSRSCTGLNEYDQYKYGATKFQYVDKNIYKHRHGIIRRFIMYFKYFDKRHVSDNYNPGLQEISRMYY